jgi:predicted XRE-type DNA-binding protein
MEITRDNLLKLVRSGLERNSLSVVALEKEAGIPKDSVRDFLRGKTYIMRADKLQKVLKVIEPDLNLF